MLQLEPRRSRSTSSWIVLPPRGTIPRNEEQRRLVRLEIYWDGAKKPAVACPVGDFFGAALGLAVPFESALFSNPEGRSFNFTIPMPYRKNAKMLLVNESRAHALVWYDVNLRGRMSQAGRAVARTRSWTDVARDTLAAYNTALQVRTRA